MTPTLRPPLPMMLPPDPLSRKFSTIHIYWEIAINISKSPQTQKNTKTWKLMIKLLSTIPLYPVLSPLFPQRLPYNLLTQQSPTFPIHWEIAILCHLHHHQKPQKNPKITIDDQVTFRYPPAPNSSPASPRDASAQSPGCKVSNFPYSLRNYNQYFKTASNTKKKHENWW